LEEHQKKKGPASGSNRQNPGSKRNSWTTITVGGNIETKNNEEKRGTPTQVPGVLTKDFSRKSGAGETERGRGLNQ